MGVLEGIDALRGKRRITAPIAVLTPLGKSKMEKPGLPEYQWRVLNCLNENGPSSVKDISRETGMSEHRVKTVCRDLESDGFIKKTGATD